MEQSAELVAALNAAAVHSFSVWARIRWLQLERPVWPLVVVVVNIGSEHVLDSPVGFLVQPPSQTWRVACAMKKRT